MGVEAPARQGVRSAHIGNMQATNNAARRDVSVSKVAELFRSWSLHPQTEDTPVMEAPT